MGLKNIKEIKRELEKIYQERKNWNGALGPFDRFSIRKRGFLLIKQYILENLIKNRLMLVTTKITKTLNVSIEDLIK